MEEKKSKFIILPWIIWGISTLCYYNQYFLRVSISGLETELVKELHINAISLSTIAASFYFSYVIMQIPSGILVDKYGARITLTFSTLLCAVGNIIFSSSAGWMMDVGRLTMGIGAAFALVAVLSLSRVWFCKEKFAIMNSITLMVGTIGALIAGYPLSYLVRLYNWRIIMLSYSFISICIAISIWFLVIDNPVKRDKKIIVNPLFSSLLCILRIKDVWLSALFSGFIFVPITIFAGLWCTPYLKEIYRSSDYVDFASSMIFIGVAIGGFLTAKISNMIKRTVLTIRLCSFGALLTMTAIIYLNKISIFEMYILLFLLGFFISGYMLSFTIVRANVNENISATAFALTNFFQICLGSLLFPIVGYFLILGSTHQLNNKVYIYSLSDYHYALFILPLSLILGMITTFFINEIPHELENFCHSSKNIRKNCLTI